MHLRLLPALLALFLALPVLAADWPGWRGPDRTDVSKETGLLRSWPKEGPPLLWTYSEAGVGYSGPAVVGDRFYSMGADDESEYVFVLDTKTGKRLWQTAIGSRFVNGYGDGPRGTPTIDGHQLYAIGGQGEVVCLEVATGKTVWKLNLKNDLGGQMMSGWGYTESPLVDGDQLICTPGGSRGTLAALDKKTGDVLWRSTELTDPAAYSSPIVAEVGGVRHYVQLTGKGVAGVAAKDGSLLWHHPKREFRTAVIPTAIFHGDHVYITAGYGVGCDLLKLTPNGGGIKAESVYANKTMINHHGGVILVDGHVYGYSDRGGWTCQDFKTGAKTWQSNALGKGSVTCADGRLYCYSERDGTVVLAEPSPNGWKEHGRFRIPQQTSQDRKSGHIWTHPVVANGKLYLRDLDLIFCFDVKANGQ